MNTHVRSSMCFYGWSEYYLNIAFPDLVIVRDYLMAFWLSPKVSTRDPIISPRAFALALALEVKIWKNTSSFFIYYNCFANIPGFFSRARSTAGEGGTEKYQPWYQPPYQPST